VIQNHLRTVAIRTAKAGTETIVIIPRKVRRCWGNKRGTKARTIVIRARVKSALLMEIKS
jgi:hypothetical protein